MARAQSTPEPAGETKAPEGEDAKVDEASPQQQAASQRAAEGGPAEVKYVGEAGVREISKADWKNAGIEHDAVVWDSSNDYTLPASSFSDDALLLLKRDRNLRIK